MSNKFNKAKFIKEEKYTASLFSESGRYIESNSFSSKKERKQWVKDELKDLDSIPEDSFFAICYDYSGLIIP